MVGQREHVGICSTSATRTASSSVASRTKSASNERVNESVNERMRALGRRSGEARRRRAKAKQTDEREPLTDREQAMRALRRALDGGNMAAMVAAAKALLDFDRTDPRAGMVTVEDARDQLEARLNEIEDRRRRHGQVCPTCSGSGIVAQASRGGGARARQFI